MKQRTLPRRGDRRQIRTGLPEVARETVTLVHIVHEGVREELWQARASDGKLVRLFVRV